MRFWLGIILCAIGFGCLATAIIWQQVLCYQMFGVVFNTDNIFIPHWSALFYLGVIPVIIGWVMAHLGS